MSNKYTYSVPFTEEQLYDAYVNKGMSQYECADLLGVSQKVIWRAMKKMGIPARKAIKRNQTGENNSSWKGGRILVGSTTPEGHRIDSDRVGKKKYFMVLCRNHPMARRDGYVFEHIKIALEAAGRDSLDSATECVHHINCIKTDNRPENLAICLKTKHRDYHASLENIVGGLVEKGIVGFDPDIGYYTK